jgi:hypothetical protein
LDRKVADATFRDCHDEASRPDENLTALRAANNPVKALQAGKRRQKRSLALVPPFAEIHMTGSHRHQEEQEKQCSGCANPECTP